MNDGKKKETPKKRKEHPIFTTFVHVGYAILVSSMIGWMLYVEFILRP
jgi:hypothetical protein